tara:strand:- start:5406 stop:5828 length:423 start_codon:yes stop_codon:yes gene_type:complete
MDIHKYRKWYLKEEEPYWGNNRFIMIKYRTHIRHTAFRNQSWRHMNIFTDDNWNHPLVSSGKAYWINNYELCVGYELAENPEIFRPVFSYKRQRFLDTVNKDIYNPIKFWNKIKSKYFKEICKIKKVPIECANYIVNFIW